MPRNGSGLYVLPPVYLAVPGTTITTPQHNDPLEDIQDTFNYPQPIQYGGTDASTAAQALINLGAVANTGSSNSITDTDAGAGVGPVFTLYRNSASPAASDLIGKLEFDGEDSAGNQQQYANWYVEIEDPTSTTEDARLAAQVITAGTVADVFYLRGTTATVFSADAGATVGPKLDLFRSSASPAASDIIGKVQFSGKDSTAVTTEYANIFATINDTTNTTEDATLTAQIVVAGTLTTGWALSSAGLSVPVRILLQDGGPGAPDIAFINDTDTGIYRSNVNEMALIAGGTTALLIQSTGIEVGLFDATGAGDGMAMATTGRFQQSGSGTGTLSVQRFYNPNGLVGSIATAASGTAFNVTSDADLKDDDGEMPAKVAEKIVRLINFHDFRWKADGTADHGVFAQELIKVYPQAVTKGGWRDRDGKRCPSNKRGAVYEPWQVDYSKLMTPVARTVQSLLKRVTDLETKWR